VLKFANQIWNLGRSDVPVRPPAVNLAFDVVLACSLVAIAFIGRWLLGYIGPNVLIFAICYPAVLAATLIAGLRCGMISLVLSTLIFWWAFVPPAYTFTILSIVDGTNVVLYGAVGATIVWIGQLYRQTLESLRTEKSRNELLVRELLHRSKNGLAVISTIVTRSLHHDPDGAQKIVGRIAALKQGEELFLAAETAPIELRDLLTRELTIYDAGPLFLSGPEMVVTGDLAKTLCMIMHELATNAIKYGAWSTTEGKVELSWGTEKDHAFLHWIEQGGPPPAPSRRAGFGTFLVERLIAQHKGQARMERRSSGIVWRLTFAGATSAAAEGAEVEGAGGPTKGTPSLQQVDAISG
jgi:two-component sensor histidine kinase